jgi:hypothetical protein
LRCEHDTELLLKKNQENDELTFMISMYNKAIQE